MKKITVFLCMLSFIITCILAPGIAYGNAGIDVAILHGGWYSPVSSMLTSEAGQYDSSLYSSKYKTRHAGVDLNMSSSATDVYSIGDGIVFAVSRKAAKEKNESVIYIEHRTAAGVRFLGIYGHTKAISGLSKGSSISRGQIIGKTTKYNSYHLHFGININVKVPSRWGTTPLKKNPFDAGFRNPATWLNENSIGSIPLPQPPSVPAGIEVTKASNTSAIVSWNTVSGATSYQVQYWRQGMSEFKNDADYTKKTATSYTSKGLGTYSTYKYRVRAINSAGASPWSAEYIYVK